ncbi:hypothetical protein K3727_12810 [Rhodobacteraceae bacterium M382]|nr:hypothetical protein K3727_12810 [Rhodobacteraceae bacterium M382]
MARILLINLAIMAVVLIGLELVFGTWFSREHALYQFTQIRDQVIVRDNPLPPEIGGGKPTITYSRDSYGFRGLDGPVSEVDILTVGGSTTDQRWVDDSQTYQAILQDLLAVQGYDVDVVNAGIDGQSTFGHIQNFPSWFDKIPDLKTDYILYYVGINDMLKINPEDIFDRMEQPSTIAMLKGFIKEHSIFYQLYRVVQGLLADKPVQHELTRTNIAENGPFVDKPVISDPLPPVMADSLQGLQRRIGELDRLTRDFGAVPIFVTQRSARWLRVNGKPWGIPEYEPDFFESVRKHLPPEYAHLNGVDFFRFEQATARIIMDECMARNAICFDLMNELDFDNAVDFYDAIHTTPSGSDRIADYLAKKISDEIFLN